MQLTKCLVGLLAQWGAPLDYLLALGRSESERCMNEL